jgi:hypothetical protein
MGSVTEFGVGLNGAAADWPAGMCAYGRRPWPGDAGELFGLGGGRVFHGALVGVDGDRSAAVVSQLAEHPVAFQAEPLGQTAGCKLSTRIAYVLARGGRGRLLDVFTAFGPSRPAQRAAFGSSRPLAAAPSGGTFACERSHGAAGAHSKRGAHTRRARLASTTPQDIARSPSIADGQEQPTSENPLW